MRQTTMDAFGKPPARVSPPRKHALLRAALVGAGLFGLAGAARAEPRPDYAADGRGVFLRFLNAPELGAEAERSPRLGLSLGGPIRPALMDTGSTGIVVSASAIPNIDALPSRPGHLTYTSSGRIMIGRWVTVPVTLSGHQGVSVSTRPIPVLAVDRIDCVAKPRDCAPEDAPDHVAMVGIGFAREGDGQSQSTPDTNPLLNAEPLGAGPIHRGYVVTRQGIHVGLTHANTRGEFHFVKLDRHPEIPNDWLGVPVRISVNDQTPSALGRGLIDTGVTGMFLTLPPAQVADSVEVDAFGHSTLLPGTRLSFSFGDAATYGITVGNRASPLAPERITLNTTRPHPFVNTGLRLLNGFDVLYDADLGYFAFRARETLRRAGER